MLSCVQCTILQPELSQLTTTNAVNEVTTTISFMTIGMETITQVTFGSSLIDSFEPFQFDSIDITIRSLNTSSPLVSDALTRAIEGAGGSESIAAAIAGDSPIQLVSLTLSPLRFNPTMKNSVVGFIPFAISITHPYTSAITALPATSTLHYDRLLFVSPYSAPCSLGASIFSSAPSDLLVWRPTVASTPDLTVIATSTDESCESCPSGARCIGNGMVLPVDDYYSRDPFSRPHRCPLRNSCGGVNNDQLRFNINDITPTAFETEEVYTTPSNDFLKTTPLMPANLCRVGYSGDLCATCVDHFFMQSSQCLPCSGSLFGDDTTSSIITFIVCGVWLLLAVYLVSRGSNRQLAHLIPLIILLQQVIILCRSASSHESFRSASVDGGTYGVLFDLIHLGSFLYFDFESLRLGCGSLNNNQHFRNPNPFYILYATIALFVITLCMVLLSSYSAYEDDSPLTDPLEVAQSILDEDSIASSPIDELKFKRIRHFRRHAQQRILIWIMVWYVRIAQVVSVLYTCVDQEAIDTDSDNLTQASLLQVETQSVLRVDPREQCWSSAHIIGAAVGAIVFIVLLLLPPLLLLLLLTRIFSPYTLHPWNDRHKSYLGRILLSDWWCCQVNHYFMPAYSPDAYLESAYDPHRERRAIIARDYEETGEVRLRRKFKQIQPELKNYTPYREVAKRKHGTIEAAIQAAATPTSKQTTSIEQRYAASAPVNQPPPPPSSPPAIPAPGVEEEKDGRSSLIAGPPVIPPAKKARSSRSSRRKVAPASRNSHELDRFAAALEALEAEGGNYEDHVLLRIDRRRSVVYQRQQARKRDVLHEDRYLFLSPSTILESAEQLTRLRKEALIAHWRVAEEGVGSFWYATHSHAYTFKLWLFPILLSFAFIGTWPMRDLEFKLFLLGAVLIFQQYVILIYLPFIKTKTNFAYTITSMCIGTPPVIALIYNLDSRIALVYMWILILLEFGVLTIIALIITFRDPHLTRECKIWDAYMHRAPSLGYESVRDELEEARLIALELAAAEAAKNRPPPANQRASMNVHGSLSMDLGSATARAMAAIAKKIAAERMAEAERARAFINAPYIEPEPAAMEPVAEADEDDQDAITFRDSLNAPAEEIVIVDDADDDVDPPSLVDPDLIVPTPRSHSAIPSPSPSPPTPTPTPIATVAPIMQRAIPILQPLKIPPTPIAMTMPIKPVLPSLPQPRKLVTSPIQPHFELESTSPVPLPVTVPTPTPVPVVSDVGVSSPPLVGVAEESSSDVDDDRPEGPTRTREYSRVIVAFQLQPEAEFDPDHQAQLASEAAENAKQAAEQAAREAEMVAAAADQAKRIADEAAAKRIADETAAAEAAAADAKRLAAEADAKRIADEEAAAAAAAAEAKRIADEAAAAAAADAQRLDEEKAASAAAEADAQRIAAEEAQAKMIAAAAAAAAKLIAEDAAAAAISVVTAAAIAEVARRAAEQAAAAAAALEEERLTAALEEERLKALSEADRIALEESQAAAAKQLAYEAAAAAAIEANRVAAEEAAAAALAESEAESARLAAAAAAAEEAALRAHLDKERLEAEAATAAAALAAQAQAAEEEAARKAAEEADIEAKAKAKAKAEADAEAKRIADEKASAEKARVEEAAAAAAEAESEAQRIAEEAAAAAKIRADEDARKKAAAEIAAQEAAAAAEAAALKAALDAAAAAAQRDADARDAARQRLAAAAAAEESAAAAIRAAEAEAVRAAIKRLHEEDEERHRARAAKPSEEEDEEDQEDEADLQPEDDNDDEEDEEEECDDDDDGDDRDALSAVRPPHDPSRAALLEFSHRFHHRPDESVSVDPNSPPSKWGQPKHFPRASLASLNTRTTESVSTESEHTASEKGEADHSPDKSSPSTHRTAPSSRREQDRKKRREKIVKRKRKKRRTISAADDPSLISDDLLVETIRSLDTLSPVTARGLHPAPLIVGMASVPEFDTSVLDQPAGTNSNAGEDEDGDPIVYRPVTRAVFASAMTSPHQSLLHQLSAEEAARAQIDIDIAASAERSAQAAADARAALERARAATQALEDAARARDAADTARRIVAAHTARERAATTAKEQIASEREAEDRMRATEFERDQAAIASRMAFARAAELRSTILAANASEDRHIDALATAIVKRPILPVPPVTTVTPRVENMYSPIRIDARWPAIAPSTNTTPIKPMHEPGPYASPATATAPTLDRAQIDRFIPVSGTWGLTASHIAPSTTTASSSHAPVSSVMELSRTSDPHLIHAGLGSMPDSMVASSTLSSSSASASAVSPFSVFPSPRNEFRLEESAASRDAAALRRSAYSIESARLRKRVELLEAEAAIRQLTESMATRDRQEMERMRAQHIQQERKRMEELAQTRERELAEVKLQALQEQVRQMEIKLNTPTKPKDITLNSLTPAAAGATPAAAAAAASTPPLTPLPSITPRAIAPIPAHAAPATATAGGAAPFASTATATPASGSSRLAHSFNFLDLVSTSPTSRTVPLTPFTALTPRAPIGAPSRMTIPQLPPATPTMTPTAAAIWTAPVAQFSSPQPQSQSHSHSSPTALSAAPSPSPSLSVSVSVSHPFSSRLSALINDPILLSPYVPPPAMSLAQRIDAMAPLGTSPFKIAPPIVFRQPTTSANTDTTQTDTTTPTATNAHALMAASISVPEPVEPGVASLPAVVSAPPVLSAPTSAPSPPAAARPLLVPRVIAAPPILMVSTSSQVTPIPSPAGSRQRSPERQNTRTHIRTPNDTPSVSPIVSPRATMRSSLTAPVTHRSSHATSSPSSVAPLSSRRSTLSTPTGLRSTAPHSIVARDARAAPPPPSTSAGNSTARKSRPTTPTATATATAVATARSPTNTAPKRPTTPAATARAASTVRPKSASTKKK